MLVQSPSDVALKGRLRIRSFLVFMVLCSLKCVIF